MAARRAELDAAADRPWTEAELALDRLTAADLEAAAADAAVAGRYAEADAYAELTAAKSRRATLAAAYRAAPVRPAQEAYRTALAAYRLTLAATLSTLGGTR
jgi:hypothetical protein